MSIAKALRGSLCQYMVMRDVQLTGLCELWVHNKRGRRAEEGRQYCATNSHKLFIQHRNELMKREAHISAEIGSLPRNDQEIVH